MKYLINDDFDQVHMMNLIMNLAMNLIMNLIMELIMMNSMISLLKLILCFNNIMLLMVYDENTAIYH